MYSTTAALSLMFSIGFFTQVTLLLKVLSAFSCWYMRWTINISWACGCGLIGTKNRFPFCLKTSQYSPPCLTTRTRLFCLYRKQVTGEAAFTHAPQSSQMTDPFPLVLLTRFAVLSITKYFPSLLPVGIS